MSGMGFREGFDPAVGCNSEANIAPGRLSPQPEGLKPFVDFCGVARSGETAGVSPSARAFKNQQIVYSGVHGI